MRKPAGESSAQRKTNSGGARPSEALPSTASFCAPRVSASSTSSSEEALSENTARVRPFSAPITLRLMV